MRHVADRDETLSEYVAREKLKRWFYRKEPGLSWIILAVALPREPGSRIAAYPLKRLSCLDT